MSINNIEQAKRIIGERVELFGRNLDQYHQVEYKEAQLRREFLDAFFEALGWDVMNRQGWAEQYKEVVNEDALRVGGATQAPDYSFRIGGARKFFAEAKKPSRAIKTDASAAYQLRRYAWSAKLPLSVLSDFEELAVYDCRARPAESDKASVGRINYFTFDQYLDRLPEIYDVFSKEAVLRGSFDRFIQEAKGKRGTTPVDAEFLKEIEGWRAALAKNIAVLNPRLTLDEMNDAVQRTIDRIIFLRMAEDRGTETYGQLLVIARSEATKQSPTSNLEIASPKPLAMTERTGRVYAGLLRLCQQADDRYNSGLFDFQADTLTPRLKIDDDKLRDLVGDLYFPKSPYEFSVLGADTLGNVYEQFLGKVIRLTASHQAKVEEKPEVKKAGGVYYTPAYIVDYIVAQTVGKLVEGKSPDELVGATLRGRQEQGNHTGLPLRVLDPACGSGSFLLGAYQRLLDHYLAWYVEHRDAKQTRDRIYESALGWRLATAEKKRILTTHIFGVDIDRQAVEVTKLSLLLKVLEGENQETLGKQLSLFKERALPNLDANIKCGNSLIGPDYFVGQLMPDAEELRRVNPFDWEREFPEVFGADETRRVSRNPSGLTLDARGFDVVIGNPPWGADFSAAEQKCIREYYAVGRNSNLDSYAVFMERAITLLRLDGMLGYITPDTFLRKDDHLTTRKFLFGENIVVELIEAGPLFSKVRDTWCLISTIQKAKPSEDHTIRHRKISRFVVSVEERLEKFGKGKWDSEERVRQSIWMQRPNVIVGYRASEAEQQIVAKMETLPRLGELTDRFVISRGEEGSKFALVEKANGKFFMVIPQDVERYKVEHGLRVSAESLTRTKIEGFYSHPKIWIIRIQKMRWEQRIVCTFDERANSAGMKTLQMVVSPTDNAQDLEYLSALLSSKLMNFWCTNYLADDMNQSYLEKIPVRTINFADAADKARHDKMVALVEQMLDLHKRLPAAQTAHDRDLVQRQIDAADAAIDALVYELYGLTEEEIKVVEGKAR